MFKKVKRILNKQNGEDAIMSIDNLLSKSYNSNNPNLSQEELNFMLVEELERSVNSGGFSSFFYHSYGNFAYETVDALNTIGALEFSKILSDAIDGFGEKYIVDQLKRSREIDENEDKYDKIWNEHDDKFYKYPDNIHELLIDYVK